LVRPLHAAALDVELPAAEMRESLRFRELEAAALELLLRLLALGDVADEREEMHRAVVVVEHDRRVLIHPDHLAVAAQEALLDVEGFRFPADEPLTFLPLGREVVRMRDVLDASREQLLLAV